MKSIRFILAFACILFNNLVLFSQGTNCGDAISLILDDVNRIYTVSPTTGSKVLCSDNAYSGTAGHVTYFQFTTNSNSDPILLTIVASSTISLEVACYQDCISGPLLDIHSMCMDDGAGIWAPSLLSPLSANTVYYLRFRTEKNFTGTLDIRGKYYTPLNDDCIGATSIGPTSINDNNACHTPGPGVTAGQLCAITLENTAWYTYTVQNTGTSTININNISCDNGDGNNNNGFQIGFFTGNCNSLTPLTCNSGAGGSVIASTGSLPAGTKVYAAIDGYSGSNCRYDISATNSVPLPVVLKYFLIEKTPNSNKVKWVTLSEKENNYFVIERSADGQNFIPITKILSNYNNESETQYSFDDIQFPPNAYYRLKQVDIDGHSTYSKVVHVQRSPASTFTAKIINPVHSLLRLNVNNINNSRIKMSIINITGNEIIQDILNCHSGNNVFIKTADKLPKGKYFLVLATPENKETYSFIKL